MTRNSPRLIRFGLYLGILVTLIYLFFPRVIYGDYSVASDKGFNQYISGDIRGAQDTFEELFQSLLRSEKPQIAELIGTLDYLTNIYIQTGNAVGLHDLLQVSSKIDALVKDPYANALGLYAVIYGYYFIGQNDEARSSLDDLLEKLVSYPPRFIAHRYRQLTFFLGKILVEDRRSTDADLVVHRAVVQAAMEADIHPLAAFQTLLSLAHHYLFTGRVERGSKLMDLLLPVAEIFVHKNTPEYFYVLTLSLIRDSVSGNFSTYYQTVKEIRQILTAYDEQGIQIRSDWVWLALLHSMIVTAENNDQEGFVEAQNLYKSHFGSSSSDGALWEIFLQTRSAYVGGRSLPSFPDDQIVMLGEGSELAELLRLARSNHLRARGKYTEAYREGGESLRTLINSLNNVTLPNLWTVQAYQFANMITENIIELAVQNSVDGKISDGYDPEVLVRAVSVLLRLESPAGAYFSGARNEIKSELVQTAARNRELYSKQFEEYVDRSIARLSRVVSNAFEWTPVEVSEKEFKQEQEEFFRYLELTRKLQEIDDYLWQSAPEYFTKSRLATPDQESIRSIAGKDNAVVWLTFLQDKLLRLCFDGSKHYLSLSDVTRSDIEKKIQIMRETLTSYKQLDNQGSLESLRGFSITQAEKYQESSFTKIGASLYRDIFQDISECIGNKKKLYFSADPVFYSLPLNALIIDSIDTADVQWFFQRYAYEFLSSINPNNQFLANQHLDKKKHALLGFGDFIPHSARSTEGKDINEGLLVIRSGDRGRGIEFLSPLPETRGEIEKLAEIYGTEQSSVYFSRDATERNFRQSRPERYATLIFATHGLVAGDYDALHEPALVLTQGSRGGRYDDGLLTASEVRSIQLNAELVILSACNTALADGSPNAQGLSSLANAFLFSGSQAVIASQWPVQTDVAPLITARMAKNIASGNGIGESLQKSMMSIVNDPSLEAFHHPSYWAPFIPITQGDSNGKLDSEFLQRKRITKDWENLDEVNHPAEANAVARNFDGTQYAVLSHRAFEGLQSAVGGQLEIFNRDGTIRHRFVFPYYGQGGDLLYTPEGDLLSLWYTRLSDDNISGPAVLMKIDKQGNIAWRRKLDTDLHDNPVSLIALGGGLYGVVVSAQDYGEQSGGIVEKIWLWIIDQNGEVHGKKLLEEFDYWRSSIPLPVILMKDGSLLVTHSRLGLANESTTSSITGSLSYGLKLLTTMLKIDISKENYPIVSRSIFPDGEIIDFELAGEDILALVRIPGAAAPGLNFTDVGVYKIDQDTMTGRRIFKYGGPSNEYPGKLMFLGDDKLVVAGFFENKKVAERDRHHNIVVTEVIPGGPASKAGIEINDVITFINDKKISNGFDLIEKVQETGEQKLDISILRDERPMRLTVRPEVMIIDGEERLVLGVRFEMELTDAPYFEDRSLDYVQGNLFRPDQTNASFVAVFQLNGNFIGDRVGVSATGEAFLDAVQLGPNQLIAVGSGGKQGRLVAQYTLH